MPFDSFCCTLLMSLISGFVATKLNVSYEDTNEDVCNLKYKVLTYFMAIFHFYTPWKRQKTRGF